MRLFTPQGLPNPHRSLRVLVGPDPTPPPPTENPPTPHALPPTPLARPSPKPLPLIVLSFGNPPLHPPRLGRRPRNRPLMITPPLPLQSINLINLNPFLPFLPGKSNWYFQWLNLFIMSFL